jgi:hypothetical protein
MKERLASGQFYGMESEGPTLFHNILKDFHLQECISLPGDILFGQNPTVAATQIAALCQVEINLG